IALPGNKVVQNAVQNSGVQNVGNQNGVIVVLSIVNQNRNGNVVAARVEGNANGNNEDSKSALSMIKVQFDKFIHSEMLKSSNYDSNAREARQDFKDYTQMEAKSFKDSFLAKNCIVRQRRRDAAYLQTQLLIAQKEEARIQLQAEEFDLMTVAADLDEIEEVHANCILMANLQQASTSGTQRDKAPVYDSDRSAEVQLHDNCYDDEIFNTFTQED
ncbi:hypothetical protein Tco_1139997, partial [Tanacetum coccineum]